MEINELQHVQLHTLLRFATASNRFNHLTFLVISGLHIGPKLTTASALDGSCCPPQR